VQEVVDLLALACGDVVDDNAVDNGINIHTFTPPEASGSAPCAYTCRREPA
jgi:hypothetical protein